MNKNATVCASVECDTQTLESFLAGGIPDLLANKKEFVRRGG